MTYCYIHVTSSIRPLRSRVGAKWDAASAHVTTVVPRVHAHHDGTLRWPHPTAAPRRVSSTCCSTHSRFQVPKLGWLQILTFIMFMEVIGILNSRRPDYEPGNFLGSSQWETDESWESYQTKELNNGRLAMFGSIGMLVGSYITGKGPLEVSDVVIF